MQYLGVIIEPGKTSLSPAIQQAAIDAMHLDYHYAQWSTPPDGLATRVTGLRAPAVRGANVTIPHKEPIIPLLDEIDDVARRVGAVNTVANDGGHLSGHNTDVEGFTRALTDAAGFDPTGARAVVVGAGGSARAVATALLAAGAASITIHARTRSRAQVLVSEVAADSTPIEVLDGTSAALSAAMESTTLLVNCTPSGTTGTPEEKSSPVPADAIHPQMLVCDLVYRPSVTPLLRDAEARGARTLGGLPMLVYQGAASLKLWSGQDPPVDVMFAAAHEALGTEGVAK
jgi:shikimate dehydrogenase